MTNSKNVYDINDELLRFPRPDASLTVGDVHVASNPNRESSRPLTALLSEHVILSCHPLMPSGSPRCCQPEQGWKAMGD